MGFHPSWMTLALVFILIFSGFSLALLHCVLSLEVSALWRLKTLSVGINLSLRCAKVSAERQRWAICSCCLRDAVPFPLWNQRGQLSVSFSRLLFCLKQELAKGEKCLCLLPWRLNSYITSAESVCATVCFCMHSCVSECVCVCAHADVHINMCANVEG